METYVYDINPVPASRPRVSKYGTYYLATYREFKNKMLELTAINRHPIPWSGPLSVEVVCNVKKPKTTERTSPNGDVDNFAKAVLDSLNGILWDDDDQIIELKASKHFTIDNPNIIVRVGSYVEQTSGTRKVRKLCVKRTRPKQR
jgi:Holliday junction resolvase RusA-like endonuclease